VCDRNNVYKQASGAVSESSWVDAGGRRSEWQQACHHFEAINVDVNRTYVRSDSEREAVRRVLRLFALRAPAVGYCQVRAAIA
jgi:Rab-GTPase-TBC domain